MANEVCFAKTFSESEKDVTVTDLPAGTETVAATVGATEVAVILGSSITQGKPGSKSGYIDAALKELGNRMRELGYT